MEVIRMSCYVIVVIRVLILREKSNEMIAQIYVLLNTLWKLHTIYRAKE